MPGYNGNAAYERPGADGSSWMQIVEKAYAQWNETGREGLGRNGLNSYTDINGGFPQVVDASSWLSATVCFPAASDTAAEQALIAAIQAARQ